MAPRYSLMEDPTVLNIEDIRVNKEREYKTKIALQKPTIN